MLTICKKIDAKNLPALKKLGYKSIICLLPDDERIDNFSVQMINEGTQAGLLVRYLPIAQISRDNARAFADACHDLPKPILAYCNTGSRVRQAYQLAVMMGAWQAH